MAWIFSYFLHTVQMIYCLIQFPPFTNKCWHTHWTEIWKFMSLHWTAVEDSQIGLVKNKQYWNRSLPHETESKWSLPQPHCSTHTADSQIGLVKNKQFWNMSPPSCNRKQMVTPSASLLQHAHTVTWKSSTLGAPREVLLPHIWPHNTTHRVCGNVWELHGCVLSSLLWLQVG